MTEDRELTKWAAKAAGLWDAENDCVDIPWNPLHGDGDALRLAVKLGFNFGFVMETDGMAHWGPVTYTEYRKQGNGEPHKFSGPMETHGDDPYAATRRAIVRAAAAIGEQMP